MTGQSLEFSSDYSNIGPACAEIIDGLAVALCPDKLVELQIALSEALNNVIEHSYEERSGMPVQVKCCVNELTVSVQIVDQGRGIPGGWVTPELGEDPSLDDLDSLPEGGMGMQLIDQCVDTITYEQRESSNVLTFTKLK